MVDQPDIEQQMIDIEREKLQIEKQRLALEKSKDRTSKLLGLLPTLVSLIAVAFTAWISYQNIHLT